MKTLEKKKQQHLTNAKFLQFIGFTRQASEEFSKAAELHLKINKTCKQN